MSYNGNQLGDAVAQSKREHRTPNGPEMMLANPPAGKPSAQQCPVELRHPGGAGHAGAERLAWQTLGSVKLTPPLDGTPSDELHLMPLMGEWWTVRPVSRRPGVTVMDRGPQYH